MTTLDYEAPEEMESGDEFEVGNFRAISFTEIDDRLLNSLGLAQDRIAKVTTNEFIIEAYLAATNIRNILGDADGMAADAAETIRSNLLVTGIMIQTHPVELIIAASKVADDPKGFIRQAVVDLIAYEVAAAEASEEEHANEASSLSDL